jgi:hypothetical protein
VTRKISREKATERGLKRYFTGKACKRGHVAERTVRDYFCIKCALLAGKKYRTAPKGQQTLQRYSTSAKARETVRRYRRSPKYLALARQFRRGPKGLEGARRYSSSPKGRATRRAEVLSRAMDTTRDDFNPVRAARLLARAYAEEGYNTPCR